MIVKKQGLPAEGDLVLCTVTKIHINSVFASLDEYENKTGMIHISEVSPGRIRNLRDFIEEGKLIVCKILKIDKERGHIDLSLRRVTESQKRNKINELKQEQLVEKIIEFVAKETNENKDNLYKIIHHKTSQNYDTIYNAFVDSVEGNFDLKSIGFDAKVTQKLDEIIKQRIKQKEIEIKGELKLETYVPNGVEIVKEALTACESTDKTLIVTYEGGGKYKLTVKGQDYKEAENILKKGYTKAIQIIEKSGGKGEFVRAE